MIFLRSSIRPRPVLSKSIPILQSPLILNSALCCQNTEGAARNEHATRADICWFLTTEPRVRSQLPSCEIRGGAKFWVFLSTPTPRKIVILWLLHTHASQPSPGSTLFGLHLGHCTWLLTEKGSYYYCSSYSSRSVTSRVKPFVLFRFHKWKWPFQYIYALLRVNEPGWRSRYSDWLRPRRPRDWSSSPGRVKNFSSPRRPDRVWGPPNLLSNKYRALLPQR
jgi:hypothetical protein